MDRGLSVRQIKSLVKKATYKPGSWWNIDPMDQSVGVSLFRKVTNSWPPHDEVVQQSNLVIPAGISHQVFKQLLRQLVHDMETHEADEWLKVDGELVNNPHDNLIRFDADVIRIGNLMELADG